MKKPNNNLRKKWVDEGFGFSVVLLNVPVVKVRGVVTPDINQKAYREAVLNALAKKNGRLTGNEVRFVRHCFEMTAQKFGRRFGGVSHVAVLKWEKRGDRATDMNWSTEKDLRLEILQFLDQSPSLVVSLYSQLEEVFSDIGERIVINGKALA